MNGKNFIKQAATCAAISGLSPAMVGCRHEYYSATDFLAAPKIDVHFHYWTRDDTYLLYADSLGIRLVTIMLDGMVAIDEQKSIIAALQKKHPGMMDFLGAFSVKNFGNDDFIEQTIATIDQFMNAGAKGIKIWKNIGMDLQDEQGNYVMADDPRLAPVFSHIEKQAIPIISHLGEPKNCWLPIEEMSIASNQYYFSNNPTYHMYLHPEKPSYEQHLQTFDNLLRKYPRLKMIAAHLASLEWSIDELAKRFDAHPNLTVDVSSRLSFLQLQALHDRAKMLSFLTKYQDKILYGSDIVLQASSPENREEQKQRLMDTWLHQWNFFATGETVPANNFASESLPKEMQGLRLPKTIVDKIFYGNAKRVLGM